MQIADHRLRLEAVETAQIVNGPLKCVPGFKGLQIANVLAEKNVAADANGDRVLEISADGQYRGNFARDADPERRVTAGPAQDAGVSTGQAHHRIVTGADDGPV